MPWNEASVTSERIRFVKQWQKQVCSGQISMSALCAEFGISRKTGYKILERYEAGGVHGLGDRSRAPLGGEHWSDAEMILQVLALREEHEWGAKKIAKVLRDADPERHWPAVSVVHEWIRKAGLIEPGVRRRRFLHPGAPPAEQIVRANQQWGTDFKGHFKTGDRKYIYPLTVADSFSRFLIGVQALSRPSFELVWPVYERLFRQYGLPDSILSDNGPPFASNSVRRLSKLAVRWIRLGIEPRLIEPGKPYQNGRLERMHRELKDRICRRPEENLRRQQQQCDRFVEYYNHVRPHEALGQELPSKHYTPSARAYPRRLPEIEYPSGWEVRRVRSSGDVNWRGQWYYLSDPLVGEYVAFERIDDSCWVLRYAKYELGYYSEPERRLHLDRPRPASPPEPNEQH